VSQAPNNESQGRGSLGNAPAFDGTNGLTIRDWYIGQAVYGLLAAGHDPQHGARDIARAATAQADAIIAQIDKDEAGSA